MTPPHIKKHRIQKTFKMSDHLDTSMPRLSAAPCVFFWVVFAKRVGTYLGHTRSETSCRMVQLRIQTELYGACSYWCSSIELWNLVEFSDINWVLCLKLNSRFQIKFKVSNWSQSCKLNLRIQQAGGQASVSGGKVERKKHIEEKYVFVWLLPNRTRKQGAPSSRYLPQLQNPSRVPILHL